MEGFVFVVLASAITYFCLISKSTKGFAVGFSILLGLLIGLGFNKDYNNADEFSKEYKIILEARGVSLNEVGVMIANQTPFEKASEVLLVLALLVPLFGVALLDDIKANEIEHLKHKCLSLILLVALYFLSLYYGVELSMLMAWIKKEPKS